MFLDEPASFNELHLVTPSLSKAATFALAGTQLFPTGTAGVTGVRLPAGFDTRPLLAVLNSPLMSAYTLGHSPGYQGGFHKFSQPYIEGLPIRIPVEGTSPTWERLGALWDARMAVEHGLNRAITDARISDLVLNLYEVTAEELRALVRGVEPLSGDEIDEEGAAAEELLA